MAVARAATSDATGAGNRERGHLAVGATSHNNRQFSGEFEFTLREQGRTGRTPEPGPGILDVGGGRDPDLTPAVVSTEGHLEPEGHPDLGGDDGQLDGCANRAPGCDHHARGFDKPALGEPILGDRQGKVAWSHRPPGCHGRDHVRRHVLQLVGHHLHAARQAERRIDVVIPSRHNPICDRGRRTIRIRVEDPDAVSHRTGRQGEHATELASTENPDGGWRRDG